MQYSILLPEHGNHMYITCQRSHLNYELYTECQILREDVTVMHPNETLAYCTTRWFSLYTANTKTLATH